jgi:hypothetical protein
MKHKTKLLNILPTIIVSAFLIGAGSISSVRAQKAPQRVTFARGATVARATGYLRGIGDEAVFVLRAKAGQHMRVEVNARGATRGMVIFPSGKQDGQPGGVIFDDNIDEAGDYHIRVTESNMADAWRGRFVLKIEILSSGQSNESGSSGSTTDLARYVGQYPSKLFKGAPGLKTRLRVLLGANYKSFFDRLQTEMPIERDGGVLIARGCMAHQCTIEESILAIDLSDDKLHVAIKSAEFRGRFKTWSEGDGSVPAALRRAMQAE